MNLIWLTTWRICLWMILLIKVKINRLSSKYVTIVHNFSHESREEKKQFRRNRSLTRARRLSLYRSEVYLWRSSSCSAVWERRFCSFTKLCSSWSRSGCFLTWKFVRETTILKIYRRMIPSISISRHVEL